MSRKAFLFLVAVCFASSIPGMVVPRPASALPSPEIEVRNSDSAPPRSLRAETLLDPVKPWIYRVKAVADVRYEFLFEDGRVKGLKVISPTGEFVSVRR